jgi:hypothetical protein
MKESEISHKIKEGWIRLKMIIEVAGFPEEHIEKSLQVVSDKIDKEKSMIVLESTLHKPSKVSEKVFSAFMEMEFLSDSLAQIMGMVYDYLPSSIEIIEPEDPISDDPQAVTMILNDLLARLHRYNQMIHALKAENVVLKREYQKLKGSK